MLAIRADRVFDGSRLLDRPVVLVDGATILDVGVAPPSGAEVVDLGDATIVPGLVDTHQHLVFNGVGTFEEMVTGVSVEDLVVRARDNALVGLRSGITTIRDLGDRDFVTLALRHESGLPTLLCAGPPITATKGHCWYLGGECEPGSVADAVHARVERGCDVIKVMASGGHGTPGFPMHQSQFTAGELRTIVDAAHALGVPVAMHCHGKESIENAIDAGVDTIEHCTFMDETDTSVPDFAVLDRMADAGVVLSSTLGAIPGASPPPTIARNIASVLDVVAHFHVRGGRVTVGTDAGIGPGKPHWVMPYAFDGLLQARFSRFEALRAMTSVGAAAIGLADRKGFLAAGYDADVLAVAGNPFADGDLTAPVGVWLRGSRVV